MHRGRVAIRRGWGVAVVACLLPTVATASTPVAAPTSSQTASCIRDPRCHRTFVVAHRAKGFGAPENSRAAVTRGVAAGVPVLDIDVRTSKDGEIFALHDGTLKRTTTGRERIDHALSGELARALLDNGEPLPRFTELYEIARGRTVLSVNFKVDVIERIASWLAERGSFDDVIFFVNTGEEMRAAAHLKKRYPAMIVMVRLLDTRVTVDSTRDVFGGRLPEILHTDPVGAGDVSALRRHGVKVFMSALRAERHVQPFRYFLVRSILGAQPDFVETDEPLAVMRKLGY
jgi:glycerophosphoryl diester phosphodiesterase